MKNVYILDCTLRDGGRILNCAFENRTIKGIASRLSSAGIDIVEIGFLRDDKLVQYKGNSTFFTCISQMTEFIPHNERKTLYTAFIDYKMYDFNQLESCDKALIKGLRVGFTKKQFDEEKEQIQNVLTSVKEKGYLLFVQGVNSLAYNDKEMLDLIDMVNTVKPYSFGIVDTYGAMYLDDLKHYYNLVNYNLDEDICIDIHSHNNFQSSFAFAQEVISLTDETRNIILDATLNGMGKCAGNLNTELIADYLIRKAGKDYDLDQILDTIDIYLLPLKNKYTWGYSIPAFMAGIYKSHPNNVIYLTEKYRLKSKDIRHILFGIDDQLRQTYDYDNIHRVYKEYSQNYVDDSDNIKKLQNELTDRTVVILAPGKSVMDWQTRILEYVQIEDAVVISINFIPDFIGCDFYFFANTLYWEKAHEDIIASKCILTSNVQAYHDDTIVINYTSLIADDGKLYDNSTIMLLNLLKRVMAKKIGIAGFDGLTDNHKNYVNKEFPDFANELTIEESNKEVRKLYKEFKNKVKGKIEVELLTPSIYE